MSEFPSQIRLSRPFLNDKQIRLAESLKPPPNKYLEIRYRLMASHIVWDTIKHFKFPCRTYCTTMILWHKLHLLDSVSSNYCPLVSELAACLLTASKIEDTPKKGRDLLAELINYSQPIIGRATAQAYDDKIYLGVEKRILQVIAFDFRINHPQPYIIKICKELDISEDIARHAWLISIDSYATVVSINSTAHVIALACIVIAIKFANPERVPEIEFERFQAKKEAVSLAIFTIFGLYLDVFGQTLIAQEYKEVTVQDIVDIQLAVKAQLGQPIETNSKVGVSLNESLVAETGTARYVLDWEREHVESEI